MTPDYFVQLEGLNTAVYDYGNNSDSTLLFIHGNSLDASAFKEQFHFFKEKGYRCIAFDLPGHGNSEKKTTGSYTIEFFANIIAKLITKLELANVLFVGHSFGGHLLLESYYQLRKAMAGLVIFGAPPMQIPPDIPAMFLPNEAAGLIFQEELKDHEISLLGKAFLKKGSIVPVTITTSIRNTDPKMRSAVGADLAEGNTKNEASIIAGADIPVAILHGEEDQLINGAYLKLITTPKLWENKVHYISNAGHMPQLEAPKQFNELLYRFSKHVFTKLI